MNKETLDTPLPPTKRTSNNTTNNKNPTFRPGSWHHHKPDYTRRRESNK